MVSIEPFNARMPIDSRHCLPSSQRIKFKLQGLVSFNVRVGLRSNPGRAPRPGPRRWSATPATDTLSGAV